MNTTDIKNLNQQSLGFQILSAFIGIVFGWAGLNITWTLTSEYEGVTFGSLLLAAPLFTVFLLGALCFWFARMTAATNQLLEELLEVSRQHQPDAPALAKQPTASQTAPTSQPTGVVQNSRTGTSEKTVCAVTDCGRSSRSDSVFCNFHRYNVTDEGTP